VPNTVCCTTGEGLLSIFNEFISITEIQTIKLAVLHRMTVFWGEDLFSFTDVFRISSAITASNPA
jgi:hypothetical protein